jgi:hypothetical protein
MLRLGERSVWRRVVNVGRADWIDVIIGDTECL